MKKIRHLLLLLIIILGLSFPLTAFAEGETLPSTANPNLNTDTSQTLDNNTLSDSTTTKSSSEDLAATNNAKISGFVWNDANKDGIFQSETEKPISGISVYLYNYGNVKSSTTTLATGDFSFTGLPSSSYEIVISSINFGAGSEISTKYNWSSSSKTNNFSKKSNDPSSWTSGTIALGSGETLINFGCGVYDPTRIETVTPEQVASNTTNPKTADETLYVLPVVAIISALGLFIISRRKINTI